MPRLNNPLNRAWLDLASANPTLIDAFSSCLLAFAAIDKDRNFRFAGTGFIVGAGDGFAFALTAKHVMFEGVRTHQNPASRHAASALFVPSSALNPVLTAERIKAAWMGPSDAGLLDVPYLSSNDTLDIAGCIVRRQAVDPPPFPAGQVHLDLTVPVVGDAVVMVTHDQLSIQEIAAPADRSGVGQTLRINRRISIRYGYVTAVHETEYRQYRWPCFTTSIPAEPGMSGGLIYRHCDGPPAACGVVCADNSTEEARANQNVAGESVIAAVWPALALQVPESLADDAPRMTLLDAMARQVMPRAEGELERFTCTHCGGGAITVKRA
jgi:hypothetical protein